MAQASRQLNSLSPNIDQTSSSRRRDEPVEIESRCPFHRGYLKHGPIRLEFAIMTTKPPDVASGFEWGQLPLEITYLILDALDWTSHHSGLRVCTTWRDFLQQPKQVAKRYHTRSAFSGVLHRTRDDYGNIIENIHQPLPVPGSVQFHRLLSTRGLGFFVKMEESAELSADEEKSLKHCYMAKHEYVRYEEDFLGCFPGGITGHLLKQTANPDLFDNETDYSDYEDEDEEEVGDEDQGETEGGSVSEVLNRGRKDDTEAAVSEDIPAFVLLPMGPCCIRLDSIPFADEPVSLPMFNRFEINLSANIPDSRGFRENVGKVMLELYSHPGTITIGAYVKAVRRAFNTLASKRTIARAAYELAPVEIYPGIPTLAYIELVGMSNFDPSSRPDFVNEIMLLDVGYPKSGTKPCGAQRVDIDWMSGCVWVPEWPKNENETGVEDVLALT